MSEQPKENILAIDTATLKLNLGLLYGGDRLIKTTSPATKSHGQIIMKKIDELFESSGLATSDLHAVVVSIGPGSFTGLRIGLAAAKGLAVALDIPLLGIGLFEIAAWKMTRGGETGAVLVQSRRHEYYVALIEGIEVADSHISVVAESELSASVGGRRLYGLGFDPTAKLEVSAGLSIGGELQYDAADLLYLGRERLVAGSKSDLAGLEPAYLQKAIAEVRFDERHKND